MIASKQKQSRDANIAARRASPEFQAFLSDYQYVPGRTVLAASLFNKFDKRFSHLGWTKRAFLSVLPDQFPRGLIQHNYYIGNIVSIRASNVTQADRDAEDRHLIAWRGCLVPHDRPVATDPPLPAAELQASGAIQQFLALACVQWEGALIPFGEFYRRFSATLPMGVYSRQAVSAELQRLGVAVALLPRDMKVHVGNYRWRGEPIMPASAAWVRNRRYLNRVQ